MFIYKTMLTDCLKCRKNTESKNPKVIRTKNGKTVNVKCTIVKYQNLSKCKKLVYY